MKQRTAALTAIALTTFVVIATLAILLASPGSRTVGAQAANDTTPVSQNSSVHNNQLDPQAREQAYRQQIEQANIQLQQAYSQIEQLQAQNQQVYQQPSGTQSQNGFLAFGRNKNNQAQDWEPDD